MSAEDREAFDNVRNQIGFCGIWCGSCVVGNGALKKLTRRYEQILDAHGLREWAPDGFDYGEFSRGLRSVRNMSVCSGCLKGGGRDNCEIRSCASAKGLTECGDCRDLAGCVNEQILNRMRTGARAAGLFVSEDDTNGDELLDEWVAKLRRTWPSCLLFADCEQGAQRADRGE